MKDHRVISLTDPAFAVNDNTAIGELAVIIKLVLSVPEDISLVGCNDIPSVNSLPTPLTTVRVPFDQIAAAALDPLTSDLVEEHRRIRDATPTLTLRRSTAAPSRGLDEKT